MVNKLKLRNITIIGLGLIGGSLVGACQRAFPRAKVFGITRNRASLRKAKSKGWIDKGFRNIDEWGTYVGARLPRPVDISESMSRFPMGEGTSPLHLVVLCTPVDTLKDFLKRLDQIAPSGTIVTDAGSVKGALVRWADRQRWRRICFVGAHPMAGSHERGIEHAHPNLFRDALTFVTAEDAPGLPGASGAAPARGFRPRAGGGEAKRSRPLTPYRGARGVSPSAPAVKIVMDFWKKISKRVVLLSPEEHDRITAEISHLPHLAAALLVEGASRKALPYAASGFLDTTRVAQGDPAIWSPIFLENRWELIPRIDDLVKRMKRIRECLKHARRSCLESLLRSSQSRRREIE